MRLVAEEPGCWLSKQRGVDGVIEAEGPGAGCGEYRETAGTQRAD